MRMGYLLFSRQCDKGCMLKASIVLFGKKNLWHFVLVLNTILLQM